MLRLLGILCAALAVAACTAVPKDTAFTAATSDRGLVVVEAEPAETVLRPGGSYTLTAVTFDPAQGVLTANSFAGHGVFFNEMGKNQVGRTYYVGRAPPGLYAVSDLTHQARWHACFNGGTQYFTVRPGEVTFLGRLDPVPALRALAGTRSWLSSSDHEYVFDTPRFEITPPDQIPGWEASLKSFLAGEYPNVNAPLVAAKLTPTTFNTGSSLLGGRVCGGYFARPKTPAAN